MYFKQAEEIAQRLKRCTQRCEKPGETFHTARDGNVSLVFTPAGRVKWAFGGIYMVSPKRGKFVAMVRYTSITTWRMDSGWVNVDVPELYYPDNKSERDDAVLDGYKPLRICVNKIERVHVQTVDERVAIAEGVKSVEEYIALWKTINKVKGTRWEDDPMVWRLWFEVAA